MIALPEWLVWVCAFSFLFTGLTYLMYGMGIWQRPKPTNGAYAISCLANLGVAAVIIYHIA